MNAANAASVVFDAIAWIDAPGWHHEDMSQSSAAGPALLTTGAAARALGIDRTTLTTVQQLNAWDILRNRTLLLTKEGLQQILA